MQKESLAQKSFYWLKVISLGLILGFGIQFAQAWTSPAAAPPGGNVSGPLTTSGIGQIKTGPLALNTDGVYANALLIPSGNVGIGTVNPVDKLDVNGAIHAYGTASASRVKETFMDYCVGGGVRNEWLRKNRFSRSRCYDIRHIFITTL